MFCPNCGKEQVGNPKYCRNCGAQLVQEPAIQTGYRAGVQPDIQPGVSYTGAMEYAGFWRRFGAWLIDNILISVISLIVFGILFFVTGGSEAIILFIYILALVGVWLYYTLMESSSSQATLGKQAFRIIVTDDNGQRISFARANGRFFSKIISGWILYIGFIMIAFTSKKQGLHDMMASTLVILK